MTGTDKERYPTIGDNVTIYANSVIIGGIKIGDNAIIGAGAVVVKDVPPKAVVAGNPAIILKLN
jgi:serine O-acetyltransferase